MFKMRHFGLQGLRTLTVHCQKRSMQMVPIPPDYSDIVLPDENNRKLRLLDPVPIPPNNTSVMKRKRKIEDIRGPETIQNRLLYKQYGVVALSGGQLAPYHLQMIRNILNKQLDFNKCFAVWRVDAPWKPLTKKGVGKTHGGGKGSITHYVTPVRAGRIVVEVAGQLEFVECLNYLSDIANRLPFMAMAIEESMYDEIADQQEKIKKENINPLTFKYIYQNNIGGCQRWISPYQKEWDGLYD